MRRFTLGWIVTLFLLVIYRGSAGTYLLTDGTTTSGDPISYNETGVVLRSGETVGQRIPWERFSQDALKQLHKEARTPRDAQLVEPFVEELVQAKKQKKKIEIKPPPKMERPSGTTGVFAMFSSPLGLVMLLLIYAGNIFAGREVAIFKHQPMATVMGASAILPWIAPLAFLLLPGKPAPPPDTIRSAETDHTSAAPEPAEPVPAPPARPAPPASAGAPAAPAASAATHGNITSRMMKKVTTMLTHESPAVEERQALPQPIVYSRGQFTFNRRFFETKMPGFFRVVPSEEEKGLVIFLRATRGEFMAKRISRITQTELFLQVIKGEVSAEEMIPFTEIQEVQVRHKDLA